MPAKKVRVSDIAAGKYFHGSREEMKAGYVITPYGGKVSRVNLVGTVIEKFVSDEGTLSSITIDDGTGAIRIKSFEGGFENIQIGDIARTVGKLREYNGELYVGLEIVRKESINLEILSRLEALADAVRQKKIVDDIRAMSKQVVDEELVNYAKGTYSMDEETLSVILEAKKKEVDYKPQVLEIIEKLDEGKGVEIAKLFQSIELPDNVLEKTLDELINDGSVYEPQPGFLRKI